MIAPPFGSDRIATLDDIDRRILELLQQDASLPVSEIAARVGAVDHAVLEAHPQAQGRRRHRRAGRALRPGQARTGHDGLRRGPTNQHNETWLASFAKAVQSIPEIVEVHRTSGDVDYLLRVVVRDIKGYDAVYKRLIKACELHDVEFQLRDGTHQVPNGAAHAPVAGRARSCARAGTLAHRRRALISRSNLFSGCTTAPDPASGAAAFHWLTKNGNIFL